MCVPKFPHTIRTRLSTTNPPKQKTKQQYPPSASPYAGYPGQPHHHQQQQHPQQDPGSTNGLSGFLGKAGTAVAGVLGATGVGGLLGLAGGVSTWPNRPNRPTITSAWFFFRHTIANSNVQLTFAYHLQLANFIPPPLTSCPSFFFVKVCLSVISMSCLSLSLSLWPACRSFRLSRRSRSDRTNGRWWWSVRNGRLCYGHSSSWNGFAKSCKFVCLSLRCHQKNRFDAARNILVICFVFFFCFQISFESSKVLK